MMSSQFVMRRSVACRAAVTRPATPQRSSAVRPVAFRNDAKLRLTSVAREFVDMWATGTNANGPTESVLRDIAQLVTPQVTVKAVHPLGNIDFAGLSGVQKKMMLDATFKSSMRPSRVLLSAADDANNVFLLLECAEMDSLDEDVNIVLLELHSVGKTYGIVKLAMDPASVAAGAPRIASVTERMQLGPADTCLLTMLYPDHKLHETVVEEQAAEKENAGRVALQLASTWHFPREAVRAKPLSGSALTNAQHAMKAWCEARNSGVDINALLRPVVADGFGLWDPYGVLPTVCGVRDKDGRCTFRGIEASSHENCVMDLDSVVNRLYALKSTYDVRCKQLGSAVSENHNVGFTHWRSEMRHMVYTSSGPVVDNEPYVIEAMAVHIFTPEGKIKHTWMLRDPYEAEKQMMQTVCTAGQLDTATA